MIWDLFLFGMFFGVTSFFACLIIGLAIDIFKWFRSRM